jgi:hypothetical protein
MTARITVEIVHCHFLDGGKLQNSCFSDPHTEPILADQTHGEHEFLRPLGCRKIGTDGVYTVALAHDLIDHLI